MRMMLGLSSMPAVAAASCKVWRHDSVSGEIPKSQNLRVGVILSRGLGAAP